MPDSCCWGGDIDEGCLSHGVDVTPKTSSTLPHKYLLKHYTDQIIFLLKNLPWILFVYVIGKNKSDSILDLFLLLFNLCVLLFVFSHAGSTPFVKENVAYSLKCTGEPILKALTFNSPFIEIKSCRTENNICPVGGLEEHPDLIYGDSCKDKGFLHQEVCNN